MRGQGRESRARLRRSNNESVTFRLDSNILRKLKKEAGDRDISPNTLVNQALKHHVEWHSIASRAGYISTRRSLLTKMLDRLTDDDIISLSENIAKTTNRDLLLVFRNKVNVETALDFVESWLRVSAIPYRHETVEDFRHSFIIQLGMGRKWSLYLGELYRHLFEECRATKFKYDARDATLSFVFETS